MGNGELSGFALAFITGAAPAQWDSTSFYQLLCQLF
jgi:hypothetical protein